MTPAQEQMSQACLKLSWVKGREAEVIKEFVAELEIAI